MPLPAQFFQQATITPDSGIDVFQRAMAAKRQQEQFMARQLLMQRQQEEDERRNQVVEAQSAGYLDIAKRNTDRAEKMAEVAERQRMAEARERADKARAAGDYEGADEIMHAAGAERKRPGSYRVSEIEIGGKPGPDNEVMAYLPPYGPGGTLGVERTGDAPDTGGPARYTYADGRTVTIDVDAMDERMRQKNQKVIDARLAVFDKQAQTMKGVPGFEKFLPIARSEIAQGVPVDEAIDEAKEFWKEWQKQQGKGRGRGRGGSKAAGGVDTSGRIKGGKISDKEIETDRFVGLMLDEEKEFNEVGGFSPRGLKLIKEEVASRSTPAGEWILDSAEAIGLRDTLKEKLGDRDARAYDALQRWMNFRLRRVSGAAISVGEFLKDAEMFMPRYGEGKDNIEAKRRARLRAVRSFAGNSFRPGHWDKVLQEYGLATDPLAAAASQARASDAGAATSVQRDQADEDLLNQGGF